MTGTTGATYAEAGVQTSSIRTPPRVSGDHVFKTPTLPLAKPLTQKPIVIEQPSDYSNTWIRREELKSLDLDLLRDYAEHYNIHIDTDTLLRSEIAATLCLKNEYIPILTTHEVARQDGRVLLSRRSNSSGNNTRKIRSQSATDTRSPNSSPESQNYCVAGTRKGPPIPTTSSSDDAKALPDEIDFASLTGAQISNLVQKLRSSYVGLCGAFQDAMTAYRAANKRAQDMKAQLQNEKVKMTMVFQALDNIVSKSGVNGGSEGKTNDEGPGEGGSETKQDEGKGKEKEKESGHGPSSANPEGLRIPLKFERRGKETGLAEVSAKDTPPTLNSPLSQARMARCFSKNVEKFIGNAGHCYFLCGFHELAPYAHCASAAPSTSSTNSTASTLDSEYHPHKSAKKRPLDESDSDNQQPTPCNPSNHDSSSTSESGPKQSWKRARIEHDEDASVQGSGTGAAGSNPSRTTLPLRRTFACDNLDNSVAVAHEFSGPETPADGAGDTSIRSTGMPLKRTYACRDLEDEKVTREIVQGPTAPVKVPSPPRRVYASLRRTISCHDLNDPEEVAREFVDVTTHESSLSAPQARSTGPSMETRWRNVPLARMLSCHDLSDPAELSRALAVGHTVPRVTISLQAPSTSAPTLFNRLWGPDVQRESVMSQLEEWGSSSGRQPSGLGQFSSKESEANTPTDPLNPMPPPPTPTRRRAREEEEEEEDSVGRQKKKVKLQEVGNGLVDPNPTTVSVEDRE